MVPSTLPRYVPWSLLRVVSDGRVLKRIWPGFFLTSCLSWWFPKSRWLSGKTMSGTSDRGPASIFCSTGMTDSHYFHYMYMAIGNEKKCWFLAAMATSLDLNVNQNSMPIYNPYFFSQVQDVLHAPHISRLQLDDVSLPAGSGASRNQAV